MQIISCSTLNAVIISNMHNKYLFVFLYVGDSNITNCISRYIPRSTTSVFLNLWLWAAHDICDGNKKNRLKNTLLNTHTHTQPHTQILHAEQGMKHSVVRKVDLISWFSSSSNDTDIMTKHYRVYHFPKKTTKTFLSALQWSSYKFQLTFCINNDGRFNSYSQMSTGFVIIMAHSCQYKLM